MSDVTEHPRLLRLAALTTGGGRRVRRLVAAAASPLSLEGLAGAGAPAAWLDDVERQFRHAAPTVLERAAAVGWRWIVPGDDDWPVILDQTPDRPMGLFVRGRLGAPPVAAAIVGSRRATTYGLRTAHRLGSGVAGAGGVVVSGMARGVDGAAHRGALEAGGRTWAVWGAGPDRPYPAEHRRLAEAIAEQGALITEYPPGAPPRAGHFPERNRLIAGLVPVVVVVQAAARSGAMATARLALDQDRDVMAVPGNIDHELSVGPNGLLRAGAIPCTMPADLLEHIGLESAEGTVADEPDSAVFRAIPGDRPITPDELCAETGCAMGEIQTELFRLEIDGAIVRRNDGRVERRR
jgi:DNA processing protein